MKWSMSMTKNGQDLPAQEGEWADPFQALDPSGNANLSCTVQRGTAYGQEKCSFTVTVSCKQDRATLDHAATLLYDTALRYANWGIHYLAGVPPIHGPLSNASTRNP